MASLKRVERVWTDLQNCLINGRKHLRELKDRAASDGAGGCYVCDSEQASSSRRVLSDPESNRPQPQNSGRAPSR